MQTTTGEAIDGAFDFGGDGVLRCYEASGSKSVYSVHVSMWIIIEPGVHFFVTWHTCMCSTVHTHQPTNQPHAHRHNSAHINRSPPALSVRSGPTPPTATGAGSSAGAFFTVALLVWSGVWCLESRPRIGRAVLFTGAHTLIIHIRDDEIKQTRPSKCTKTKTKTGRWRTPSTLSPPPPSPAVSASRCAFFALMCVYMYLYMCIRTLLLQCTRTYLSHMHS